MILTPDRSAELDTEDQAKLDPILFVDEDPDVRALSATILRRGGYEVRAATGVKEALGILADPKNKFALVITDIVMPGPDGGTLVTQLRTLRKGTPVLAISSFSPYSGDGLTFEDLGLEADTPFLLKPYQAAALLAAVKSALRGPRPKLERPNWDDWSDGQGNPGRSLDHSRM